MLPELPEELLQQIFANLQVSDTSENVIEPRLSRQTLTAVCRASKQCCRLAQPILFHTVHLGGAMQISIRAFWELLVHKPQLASFVRSLHIEDWEYPRDEDEDDEGDDDEGGDDEGEDDEDDNDEQDSTAEVSQALQDATRIAMKPLRRILGPAYKMALSRQLAGIEDGMLVYIIVRCENLSCLELMVPHLFAESSCVYLAMEWMADLALTDNSTATKQQLTRALPQLQELRMHHWDTENAFHITNAIPFWDFPTLKTFKGDMIFCQRGYGLGDAPTVKECNIRELSLDSAIIEADVLRILLRHCPKLEVLSIIWGSAVVGDCAIDHHLLGQALRHHPGISKNLKKLILNPINAFDYEHFDGEYRGPLGSLKSFQSLQHLGLDPRGLIGEGDEEDIKSVPLTDMLPESLQTLEVFTWGYDYSGVAFENMMKEMMPLDTQLYALMSDDRFSKLSTIKMVRPINEEQNVPKDVGWKQIRHQPFFHVGQEYILSRDVEQSADF